MRFRTYTARGVVLRQFNLGEADRILSILTPGHGKVRAVARGVRRPKSKLRGSLDLTNLIDFSAAYGRDLDVVNEAQIRDDHPRVRSELSRLSKAIYACEIADSFAQERSPGGAQFDLMVDVLEALGDAPDPWTVVRWFETRMLDVSGFKPELESCVECFERVEPGSHLLDLGAGGVLCPQCRSKGMGHKVQVSEGAMRVLRHLQRSVKLTELAPMKNTQTRSEVEFIQTRYIRSVLERDLRSADFMRLAAELEPQSSSIIHKPARQPDSSPLSLDGRGLG